MELEEPEEIKKFRRELRARKYSISSEATYISCLKFLYFKVDKELKIEKIKDHIITIKKRSYHKQMVATTRNYYDFVLGIELDLKKLPYPRKEYKIPEVFSKGEMKKMIEYPKNLKHQLVMCLLYNCGLRIGELLHLKPEQINRERGVIKVENAKGNKERYIPFNGKLMKLYDEYFAEWKPEKYVFNGQKKLLYTESSVNQSLKYWAKKSGVYKHIHAHKLRHTYATHLHESGVDINIIKELLGHEDVKTTEVYLKTSQAYTSNLPSLLTDINVN